MRIFAAGSDKSQGVTFEYSLGSLCADGVRQRRVLITATCNPNAGTPISSVRCRQPSPAAFFHMLSTSVSTCIPLRQVFAVAHFGFFFSNTACSPPRARPLPRLWRTTTPPSRRSRATTRFPCRPSMRALNRALVCAPALPTAGRAARFPAAAGAP